MDRRFRSAVGKTALARVLIGTLLLAGAAACLAGPVLAVTVDIGPETIVMLDRYEKPASFPHRRHQEWRGCTACHHVENQVMTIDKCGSCHNESLGNARLDSVRKACHVLCKDCHSKERASGRPAPSGCSACHPRAD